MKTSQDVQQTLSDAVSRRLAHALELCSPLGQDSCPRAVEKFDMTLVSSQTRDVYSQFIPSFLGEKL